MPSNPITTLQCLVQSRLGGLDRVICAFTHRGIIPAQLFSEKDDSTGVLRVTVSFEGLDARAQEKLVKFLQKQVYVLEAQILEASALVLKAPGAETAVGKVAELFGSDFVKRKGSHVHNA